MAGLVIRELNITCYHRTNLHSSPTFRINVSQSNQPIHHLRHLDSIASSIPTVSTWWTLLQEESSILELSRNMGDDFTRIRYARMYDQGQIDNFIINMKTYTGQLRDLRFRLEAQPCQYSPPGGKG
jgi:hypothetical protein